MERQGEEKAHCEERDRWAESSPRTRQRKEMSVGCGMDMDKAKKET